MGSACRVSLVLILTLTLALTSYYAPDRWSTGVMEMLRRLVPCWLVLLQYHSRVLLASLVFSYAFVVSSLG